MILIYLRKSFFWCRSLFSQTVMWISKTVDFGNNPHVILMKPLHSAKVWSNFWHGDIIRPYFFFFPKWGRKCVKSEWSNILYDDNEFFMVPLGINEFGRYGLPTGRMPDFFPETLNALGMQNLLLCNREPCIIYISCYYGSMTFFLIWEIYRSYKLEKIKVLQYFPSVPVSIFKKVFLVSFPSFKMKTVYSFTEIYIL